MMKRCLLIIALMALIFLTACPVQAVNVSFTSIDGVSDRDMYLYQSGVFVGLYNTTSTAIDLTQDTEIVFRPQTANLLENPTYWVTNVALPFVQTHAIGLLVLGAIVGIALRGRFR